MGIWQFLAALGGIISLSVVIELLLKCYIAAFTEKGALAMVLALEKRGLQVISDILGEAVSDVRAARRNTARIVIHLRHLARLKRQSPETQRAVSIKLSHIGLSLGPGLVRKNLKRIYRACQYYDIDLEIDMEGPEAIEDTISIARSLLRFGNEFRQAIQANQTKSRNAVLVCGRYNIKIRLVKGAYPGDITSAEIDENFCKLAALAKEFDLDVAYGSHDLTLIARVQAIYAGEVQMLFGIRMWEQSGLAEKCYMAWGPRLKGIWFWLRRVKEGARPNVFWMFLRNIPESLIWRIRYAPLTFFM